METYRLKNIAILILVLLNGFLLALLGYQLFESRLTATDAVSQLIELYAAKGMVLDSGVDFLQQPLLPLTLSRDIETDRSMAAQLLGDDPISASQGGGIYSYATERGTVQFRSGGSFDGSFQERAVEVEEGFAWEFCARFGYEDMEVSRQGGTVRVTARQRADGIPIAGCELTMQFQDGTLTSVTGTHVSLADASGETARQLDCVTALVRFLDYRETSSILCSAVTGVDCIYVLQGGGAAVRLLPVWQVETDTYTFFVDCASGEVTRR